MGQTSQNPFHEALLSYTLIQTDEGNNITILRNKEDKSQILIRKWIFNERQECHKLSQIHNQRQKNSSQYLQQLLKHTEVKTEDLCNTMFQLYCMWEHHPTSLSCQIERRLHSNKQFTDKQINSIMASVAESLSILQQKNIKYQKLTVQSIKIDDHGNIKVCDPLSLPFESNYSRVYSNHETDRIYLSPQQSASLSSSQVVQRSCKNDIWTFGMVLLELGLLEDQNSCYRQECRRIQWNRIAQNLNRFGKLYDSKTKQLIEKMLSKNGKDRPGWGEIKNKIAQNMRKQQVLQNGVEKKDVYSKKKSPQVYAYKQYNDPNSQILSYANHIPSQTQFPCPLPPNYLCPAPRHQPNQVSFTYNPIHHIPTTQNKQNVMLINHRPPLPGLPPLPHLNHQPHHHTFSYQNSIISNHNQFNVPSIMSITASKISSQDNLKKFMSSASSVGFLFSGLDQKEQPKELTAIEQQKIAETHHIPDPTAKYNPSSHKRFCNNQIKNAQSITYEGDFQNVLVHQFRTADHNKVGQPVEKSNQSTEPAELRTLQAASTEPENPQFSETDELQYVVQNFKVGSRYEGYKLRNMRHGEGKFYYQDGGMYDGCWYHNKMNGKGSLYYQSGTLAYQGNWKNDQFEGRGRLNNQVPENLDRCFDYRNFDNIGECWEYYDGQFVDDMKQGRGKLMLTNGEYYVGSFKEDMIDGNGKYFSKKGVIKGVWEANQLIKIQ